jgi:hypothetical protein
MALRYKTSFEELTQGLLGLMQEFLHYLDKNDIEVPDKETYYQIVSRIQDLILVKPGADGSLQEKSRRGLDSTFYRMA